MHKILLGDAGEIIRNTFDLDVVRDLSEIDQVKISVAQYLNPPVTTHHPPPTTHYPPTHPPQPSGARFSANATDGSNEAGVPCFLLMHPSNHTPLGKCIVSQNYELSPFLRWWGENAATPPPPQDRGRYRWIPWISREILK